MHFRFRNNIVQVIRTTYDPATKKPRAEIVGRLSRAEPAVGDDLRAACSTEELVEVQRWITGHMKAHSVATEHAARTLADQLEMAGEWFAAATDTDSARQVAADVQQQWSKLRNQLRRGGLLE